jgi:hypothetical protein
MIMKGCMVEEGTAFTKKLRENKREGIIFLSFVALFVVILLGIRGLNIGNAHNPGAAFMPFWSGVLLLLLVTANFWINVRKGSKGVQEAIRPGIKTMLVLAGILAYIVITPYLGFILTIFLLLVFFFSLIERKNFGLILLTSGVTSLVVYLIFVTFMKCQFPRGILGIG